MTWGSRLAQNRLNLFLGKLSLPIYLSQISGIRLAPVPSAPGLPAHPAGGRVPVDPAASLATLLLAKGVTWLFRQLRNRPSGVDKAPDAGL